MSEEAEIVEAGQAIEVSYEYQPAVLSADFGAMRAKAQEFLAPYEGMTAEQVAQMPMKVAKSNRAELAKLKKELNDARLAIQREYDKPLKAFKAEVDSIISMIDGPWAVLDAGVKQAEAAETAERREKLRDAYEDFCPALVPMVPFETIIDQKWLTKTFGEKKAEQALCDKAAKIAKDWDVLKKTALSCPNETEVEFFRTLDLTAALEFDKEHAEELQRLEELRAEVAPEPIPEPAPSIEYGDVRRFSIEVPRTEFTTSIDEARALKNHLALLGIKASMTIYSE